MAARTSTSLMLSRTLCLLVGWFLAVCIIAEAQELPELRELFLREPERILPEKGADEGPARLVEALKESSWSNWALLRQGERNIELGRYELADYAMSELIASHPQSMHAAMALLNRGTAALVRKEFGRARFYFSEAITEAMKR